jgi:hypothetical protein
VTTAGFRHRNSQRRRTGIEPACDAKRRTPVLKTGGATRHPDASAADVTRDPPEPAIRPAAQIVHGSRRPAPRPKEARLRGTRSAIRPVATQIRPPTESCAAGGVIAQDLGTISYVLQVVTLKLMPREESCPQAGKAA